MGRTLKMAVKHIKQMKYLISKEAENDRIYWTS